MRHLLQPQVLNLASLAAAVSALACYPRLSLWLNRPEAVWFLEFTLFICGAILWGFVFAWHTPYTSRPVFVFKIELKPFVVATALGLVAAAISRQWLDPTLRLKFPEEYPNNLQHWLAWVPFTLALNQLFLIFAPFDWLIRLLKNRWLAAGLTAVFGVSVALMKLHTLAAPIPPLFLTALLAGRFVSGWLAVWLYLRGGVLLVWWWTFLVEARHLLNFLGHS